MKHILNNLTEEEKNSIREQHTGGMKFMTENFNKLLNSKLGDSKPLISEQAVSDPEKDPIQKPFFDHVYGRFSFGGPTKERDQNGNIVMCNGPCKSKIPGTDVDAVTWDYKKGIVSATKSFGIDPKPISIKSNFDQMRKWFDKDFPLKQSNSGGGLDGL